MWTVGKVVGIYIIHLSQKTIYLLYLLLWGCCLFLSGDKDPDVDYDPPTQNSKHWENAANVIFFSYCAYSHIFCILTPSGRPYAQTYS